MNEIYKYIVVGNYSRTICVHSDLNYFEFLDYIFDHKKQLAKDSNEYYLKFGKIRIVQPKIYIKGDFVSFCPEIICTKKDQYPDNTYVIVDKENRTHVVKTDLYLNELNDYIKKNKMMSILVREFKKPEAYEIDTFMDLKKFSYKLIIK